MSKHEHLVADFWNALNSRNWEQAHKLLHEQFKATWPNTSEEFNRKQFILINESYPGKWDISIKRLLLFVLCFKFQQPFFFQSPPPYPVKLPFVPITLWQGIMIAILL